MVLIIKITLVTQIRETSTDPSTVVGTEESNEQIVLVVGFNFLSNWNVGGWYNDRWPPSVARIPLILRAPDIAFPRLNNIRF